jgi:hypothetical protein
MKVVGECDLLLRCGSSCPRGETAPPITVISGETAFRAS